MSVACLDDDDYYYNGERPDRRVERELVRSIFVCRSSWFGPLFLCVFFFSLSVQGL